MGRRLEDGEVTALGLYEQGVSLCRECELARMGTVREIEVGLKALGGMKELLGTAGDACRR